MNCALKWLLALLLMLVGCAAPPPPDDTGLLPLATVIPAGIQVVSTLPPTLATPIISTACGAAVQALPDYQPFAAGEYVRVASTGLAYYGQPFRMYGINYYPRDYPGELFLTAMNVDETSLELDLMLDSRLNTLRIYVRHADLFMCQPEAVIPNVENFARLDAFIRVAATRGFKLLLTLTHGLMPDADLYGFPAVTLDQMGFIGRRYAGEPAVMGYDLREVSAEEVAAYPSAEMLRWTARAVATLRAAAPYQLITMTWPGVSAAATAPLVDFVSFRHEDSAEALRQQIALLLDATTKPVALTWIGYDSAASDDLQQRDELYRALEAVERNGLIGWVVWAAFDAPDAVTRYGLWNFSYYPKQALGAVRFYTGQ